MKQINLSMKKNKQALLLKNEELLARVELQGQLINTVEKEIYENINQVLCLARIKLTNIDFIDKGKSEEILEQSGNLIAKAIVDLRNLVKRVNTSGNLFNYQQ